VYVTDERVTKIYFGAHGSKSGVWKTAREASFYRTHPIAHSCHGDHSFYPSMGCYPRIVGTVYDECKDGIVWLSEPKSITRVYDEHEAEFDPSKHGWVYFPGKMNVDGINAPVGQWFWDATFPEDSNNWFKRLFCCDYF
jgi:hypothetical protein